MWHEPHPALAKTAAPATGSPISGASASEVDVPAAALIFRPKATQVARVDAQNKIEFQNVTIARDNGSVVELGSGVHPGDRLVLNISSQIAEGQSVTPTDSDAAPKRALDARR